MNGARAAAWGQTCRNAKRCRPCFRTAHAFKAAFAGCRAWACTACALCVRHVPRHRLLHVPFVSAAWKPQTDGGAHPSPARLLTGSRLRAAQAAPMARARAALAALLFLCALAPAGALSLKRAVRGHALASQRALLRPALCASAQPAMGPACRAIQCSAASAPAPHARSRVPLPACPRDSVPLCAPGAPLARLHPPALTLRVAQPLSPTGWACARLSTRS